MAALEMMSTDAGEMTYLGELLAVLLLLELLPVPVDLDVLFVRLDDFDLDLVD